MGCRVPQTFPIRLLLLNISYFVKKYVNFTTFLQLKSLLECDEWRKKINAMQILSGGKKR